MKKYISIGILALFIIPSVTFASWWNPVSWFRKAPIAPTEQVKVVETNVVSTPIDTISVTPSVPESKVNERVIERVVEKPVIKTITVQDPALQKQINDLIAENTDLKAQVARLMKANQNLASSNASSAGSGTTLTGKEATNYANCEDARVALHNAQQKLVDISDKYSNLIAERRLNLNGSYGGAMEADIRSLQQKQQVESQPFESARDRANSDYLLYCNR